MQQSINEREQRIYNYILYLYYIIYIIHYNELQLESNKGRYVTEKITEENIMRNWK